MLIAAHHGDVRTLLIAIVGTVAAAWFALTRRAAADWGSTPEERARQMPGDDWVPDAGYANTKAITVNARPEHIWPWLAQMGNGRGGLYSVDWLDRLFGILDAPSAEVVLPEYQDLRPGDEIPIGAGGNFPVRHVERERVLVLAGDANGTRWSWTFGLYEQPDGATRLVSRNRVSVANPLMKLALTLFVDPAAFIMTRQMLVNLRRRAERLAVQDAAPVPRHLTAEG